MLLDLKKHKQTKTNNNHLQVFGVAQMILVFIFLFFLGRQIIKKDILFNVLTDFKNIFIYHETHKV